MAFYKVTFSNKTAGPDGNDIDESGTAYHYADTRNEAMALVKNNIKASLAKEYQSTVQVEATKVDLESEQQSGSSET